MKKHKKKKKNNLVRYRGGACSNVRTGVCRSVIEFHLDDGTIERFLVGPEFQTLDEANEFYQSSVRPMLHQELLKQLESGENRGGYGEIDIHFDVEKLV